jgi:hypothetical protein
MLYDLSIFANYEGTDRKLRVVCTKYYVKRKTKLIGLNEHTGLMDSSPLAAQATHLSFAIAISAPREL